QRHPVPRPPRKPRPAPQSRAGRGERSRPRLNLHEYQAKELLAARGVPILPGKVARTPADARAIAREIGKPVVVKAQVLVGGRGKAGGVKLAKTPDEAELVAEQILGMEIKGITVHKVLVAEAADIA